MVLEPGNNGTVPVTRDNLTGESNQEYPAFDCRQGNEKEAQ